MGPTVLFDKSFLQSLTLDEAVIFDHFFISVISPACSTSKRWRILKNQRERARNQKMKFM